jgi:hypothetical protein
MKEVISTIRGGSRLGCRSGVSMLVVQQRYDAPIKFGADGKTFVRSSNVPNQHFEARGCAPHINSRNGRKAFHLVTTGGPLPFLFCLVSAAIANATSSRREPAMID